MIVLNLEENICKRKINYYREVFEKNIQKNYEKILENIEGCRKNLRVISNHDSLMSKLKYKLI